MSEKVERLKLILHHVTFCLADFFVFFETLQNSETRHAASWHCTFTDGSLHRSKSTLRGLVDATVSGIVICVVGGTAT